MRTTIAIGLPSMILLACASAPHQCRFSTYYELQGAELVPFELQPLDLIPAELATLVATLDGREIAAWFVSREVTEVQTWDLAESRGLFGGSHTFRLENGRYIPNDSAEWLCTR